MHKYLLSAVAAVALATPATARDNSWYAGVEGGVLMVQDLELDYVDADLTLDNAIDIDHKLGFDVDLIGGYDFGGFRAEAEIGYKRAGVDSIEFDPEFDLDDDDDDDETAIEADGRASAISAMANLLADFGSDDGFSGYIGGGIGLARVKYRLGRPDFGTFSDEDDTFAWQIIAGFRAALSPNTDFGLKYRYFRTGKLDFANNVVDTDDDGDPFDADGKWRSHSLLASLIFNFAPPPPPPPPMAPPPPAPVAPATQTCPDGTVILATESCPLPPPPPPPPPPAGERG